MYIMLSLAQDLLLGQLSKIIGTRAPLTLDWSK